MSKFEKDYKVSSIPREQTKEWLIYKHYAGRMPSISYSFGLYHFSKLVGVCTYGLPASENAVLLCGEEERVNVLELNRLIKDDGLPKNIQSWFVSQTFKLLPKPKIILSYADPNNGHNGYTYQALNFLFTGNGGSPKEYYFMGKQYTSRHIKDYWFRNKGFNFDKDLTIDQNFKNIGGKILEQKPKNRYVIFLGSKKQKNKLKNKLKWEILPYPKGENTNYDTSHKTTTQTTLF